MPRHRSSSNHIVSLRDFFKGKFGFLNNFQVRWYFEMLNKTSQQLSIQKI